MKPVSWFAHVRPDGDISGNIICEKCLTAYEGTHPNGFDRVMDPDPIKECVCCRRRVGMPKNLVDLGKFGGKKEKQEWSIKI
jgi:hypothetical protein